LQLDQAVLNDNSLHNRRNKYTDLDRRGDSPLLSKVCGALDIDRVGFEGASAAS
jgi:hypothetical protein